MAGAPLEEGDVNLTKDPDETGSLYMRGRVTGPDGEPVKDAVLHVGTPIRRAGTRTSTDA